MRRSLIAVVAGLFMGLMIAPVGVRAQDEAAEPAADEAVAPTDETPVEETPAIAPTPTSTIPPGPTIDPPAADVVEIRDQIGRSPFGKALLEALETARPVDPKEAQRESQTAIETLAAAAAKLAKKADEQAPVE